MKEDDAPWFSEEEVEKGEHLEPTDNPLDEILAKNKQPSATDIDPRLKMKVFHERLRKEMKDGREGRSIFLPLSLSEMGKQIQIQPGQYSLIGGHSSTGKTAFAHQNYILHPYNLWRKARDPNNDFELGFELRIVLFNMERSYMRLAAKWMAYFLWNKYGMLVDENWIKSRGMRKGLMTDEQQELIDEAERWVYDMGYIMDTYSMNLTPAQVKSKLEKLAAEQGSFQPVEGSPNDMFISDGKPRLTIVVLDHMGRVKQESRLDERGTINKMSAELSYARDHYGFSPAVVAQFNRNMSETARRNKEINPEAQDFAGSSNMYMDCDLAFGILDPAMFNQPEHRTWSVGGMRGKYGQNRFRGVYVLKNSDGISQFDTGAQFVGEVGLFRELSKETYTDEEYKELADPKANYDGNKHKRDRLAADAANEKAARLRGQSKEATTLFESESGEVGAGSLA